MNVNVFILHYADEEVTGRCVESFTQQTTDDQIDLIVIDNGSPTPLKQGKTFNYPSVEIIRLEDNLHLIQAFNAAMVLRPADAYVCVTNDTVAASWLLATLLEALGDPTVGIVAPGTNDVGAGVLYVANPSGHQFSQEVHHVDNVCWAWRQDLVDTIGYPDSDGHEHRANWSSNQDYCYRARQAGYRVLAVRGAYIEHAHTGGQDAEAWRAGRDWLIRKWGDKAEEVWA